MPKIYLVYQKRWKEYWVEIDIVYESPTVEQLLNLFTKLFNRGVSHSVLVSAKGAVAHVVNMKYKHIHHNPSVKKCFKRTFKLRLHLPKMSFAWDIQIMFDYFRSLGANSKISDEHLLRKLL